MKKTVFLNNPPSQKVVTHVPIFRLVIVSPLHWLFVRDILFSLTLLQEGVCRVTLAWNVDLSPVGFVCCVRVVLTFEVILRGRTRFMSWFWFILSLRDLYGDRLKSSLDSIVPSEEEDIDRRGSLPATPRGQRMTDLVAFQVAIQFIIFF